MCRSSAWRNEMPNNYDRRDFIKHSLLTGALLPLAPLSSLAAAAKPGQVSDELDVSIFSKHLQFLNYKDTAAVSADIGFDGVELAVRNRGHVLPENVEQDLPRAVAAIKEAGLHADLMVSGIRELDPLARTVLETAASQGIKSYRMGYLRYPETGTIPEALAHFNAQTKELAEFNKSLGIQGCHQNHNGTGVGSNVWELYQLLEGTEQAAMGAQYDIYHAVVEGGRSWRNGIRLLEKRIANIVIKDFRWEKIDGEWQVYKTPLGEGMVDFDAYFKILKGMGINVPVAIHYEYDLFGAERGRTDVDKSKWPIIYEAMHKDLQLLRKMWRDA